VLWMNTVGPYHNRQETYGYYTLPFCMGPKESIGRQITLRQFHYGTSYLRIRYHTLCIRWHFCRSTVGSLLTFLLSIPLTFFRQCWKVVRSLPFWYKILGFLVDCDLEITTYRSYLNSVRCIHEISSPGFYPSVLRPEYEGRQMEQC